MSQRLLRLAEILDHKHKLFRYAIGAAPDTNRDLIEKKKQVISLLESYIMGGGKPGGVIDRYNGINTALTLTQRTMTSGGKQKRDVIKDLANYAVKFGTQLETDKDISTDDVFEGINSLLILLSNILQEGVVLDLFAEKNPTKFLLDKHGLNWRNVLAQAVYNGAFYLGTALQKIANSLVFKVSPELAATYKDNKLINISKIDMQLPDENIVNRFLAQYAPKYGIKGANDPLWYYIYRAPDSLPTKELQEEAYRLRTMMMPLIRTPGMGGVKREALEKNLPLRLKAFKEAAENAGVKEFRTYRVEPIPQRPASHDVPGRLFDPSSGPEGPATTDIGVPIRNTPEQEELYRKYTEQQSPPKSAPQDKPFGEEGETK